MTKVDQLAQKWWKNGRISPSLFRLFHYYSEQLEHNKYYVCFWGRSLAATFKERNMDDGGSVEESWISQEPAYRFLIACMINLVWPKSRLHGSEAGSEHQAAEGALQGRRVDHYSGCGKGLKGRGEQEEEISVLHGAFKSTYIRILSTWGTYGTWQVVESS